MKCCRIVQSVLVLLFMIAGQSGQGDPNWLENLSKAKEQAANEKKLIVVWFDSASKKAEFYETFRKNIGTHKDLFPTLEKFVLYRSIGKKPDDLRDAFRFGVIAGGPSMHLMAVTSKRDGTHFPKDVTNANDLGLKDVKLISHHGGLSARQFAAQMAEQSRLYWVRFELLLKARDTSRSMPSRIRLWSDAINTRSSDIQKFNHHRAIIEKTIVESKKLLRSGGVDRATRREITHIKKDMQVVLKFGLTQRTLSQFFRFPGNIHITRKKEDKKKVLRRLNEVEKELRAYQFRLAAHLAIEYLETQRLGAEPRIYQPFVMQYYKNLRLPRYRESNVERFIRVDKKDILRQIEVVKKALKSDPNYLNPYKATKISKMILKEKIIETLEETLFNR